MFKKVLSDYNINMFFVLTFGMAITAFYPIATEFYNSRILEFNFGLVEYLMLITMYIVVFINSKSYKDFKVKNLLNPFLNDAGFIDLFGYTFMLVSFLDLYNFGLDSEKYINLLLCFGVGGVSFLVKHILRKVLVYLEKVKVFSLKFVELK
jgi:hypothetical protein